MKMEHLKKQYHWLFSTNAMLKVDEGWTWLVSGLCQALEEHEKEDLNEPVKITGVGQSFGALSIKFTGGGHTTELMIHAVELISHQVCQLCASTEEAGSTFGPFIFTVCKQCWSEDEKYHVHLFNPNRFSETAATKIEAGLLVMPEGWFKKRLGRLVNQ